MSIRWKLTGWFAAALFLVTLLSVFALLFSSRQLVQKSIRDELTSVVDDNADDVEYRTDGELDDAEYTLLYDGGGYLVISNDFLPLLDLNHTGLYRSDGALLYGSAPADASFSDEPFVHRAVRTASASGRDYYICDWDLAQRGLAGYWLRGVVTAEQGHNTLVPTIRLFLVILVVVALVALGGGYLIARQAMRPIDQITETANQIAAEGTLKRRIDLGPGKDELHQLADGFNEMLQRLESSFETEQRFFSDASHELRTPLSVIAAQCELSLSAPQSQEEYDSALRTIQRQSLRMNRLVDDMLDFTRLETNPQRYPKEPLDLSELVECVCADMALAWEGGGIALLCDAAEGVSITGNRELLARLLTNLITNAYRYGKPGGHIWVALARREEAVRLSVRDDGIGIAAEDQARVFHRLYQVDPSRSSGGLGLGLALAQEIAQFHKGAIQLQSTPGRGSTFTVILPA